MSTLSEPWGHSEAKAFVLDLFLNVLRLDSIPEKELAAWTKRALETSDPVAIFRAVSALPVHQQNMTREKDTRTRWPPGHFYSPGISRQEVEGDRCRILADRSLVAVELREDAQVALFPLIAGFFDTIPFTDHPSPGLRYHYTNPSYNYGDAIIYWAILNALRPKRIIEIGSGFSSALALDAIDLLKLPTVCTFVDPYPAVAEAITAPLRYPHSIVPKRVQALDPQFVESLEDGDLLFIDSSHVLKAGSDVHFELTELLPRLQRGVYVHFHDMFANFEYPESWILKENHGWNEQYAVHTFLMFNTVFQIEYFNHYFARKFPEIIRRLAAKQAERILLNPGGGLWLRRV
jgi:hypothetical protein